MSTRPKVVNCQRVQFETNRDFDYALSRFADGLADLPQSVEDDLSAEVYRRAAIVRAGRNKLQKASEEKHAPVEIPVISSAYIFQG